MSDEDQSLRPTPEDHFWALVELSGGNADKLKSILLWFPQDDIIAFDLRLGEVVEQLDRDDIHVVTGGSSRRVVSTTRSCLPIPSRRKTKRTNNSCTQRGRLRGVER